MRQKTCNDGISSDLPKVAIIIPTLNEENFIEQCLRSIMELDYPANKLTVIVADNMSEDRTVEIALRFPVKVVDVQRRTIAYTRNIGASYAEDADLLAFLDADCIVSKDWLHLVTRHFSENGVVAAGSYPSVRPEKSNRIQMAWSLANKQNSKGIRDTDWLPSANLVVDRKAFEQVGGFNVNLVTCEDADLGYRLRKLGRLIYDPTAMVYHLREPSNLREFFVKERWHSKNSLYGFFAHGCPLSELPSVFLPAIFGVGLILLVASLAFTCWFAIPAIVCVLFPPCIYVIKARPKIQDSPLLFLIYIVYLLARSFSLFEEFIRILLTAVKR